MKTINIKGKEYVPVNERIKFLSNNYKYSINTEYTYFEERKMPAFIYIIFNTW